ncbi:hypothetical protein LB553_04355 [Mesorhizobium sp. CA8]|uniref:hypothetical protein n=1 Tax=Mesorhizobium sp. CA8 TaxID=2876637 RepID=UPI001CCDB24F|nr:hypothetical protein [Mesorhizobium sp. CA8]MBZ9760108.1 hypothetical protein [Mesorhizobium sp. CA8]
MSDLNSNNLSDDGLEPVDEIAVEPAEYKAITGESLGDTLDINTWQSGVRAIQAFDRLEQEIEQAEQLSDGLRKSIRENIFPHIRSPGAPPCAGVFRATLADVKAAQNNVLFNGLVEACDANSHLFHTLSIQIIQIAVATTSYYGQEEMWAHRIYRRDIPLKGGPSVLDETLEILRRRSGGPENNGGRRKITDMMRRGVMTYMERVVLADKAQAPWRVGHGNPLAYELLSGAGITELIQKSIPVLDRLILQHKRFLFIPSTTKKEHFLTIGDALDPLEYAIIDDATADLDRILEGNYRGEWKSVADNELTPFCREAGPAVVAGVYRASAMAPARMFYAHRDYAHEAAHIAMADSVLQEHRGFPMLIDMADGICGTYFGAETLNRPSLTALSNAGQPYRYLDERTTRA